MRDLISAWIVLDKILGSGYCHRISVAISATINLLTLNWIT